MSKSRKSLDIIPLLERIGDTVNNMKPDINAGGCCVYAAKILQLLQQHKIPSWGIVAADGDNLSDATSPEWLDDNWEMNWHHVLVGFEYQGKEYIVDSNGVSPLPDVGKPDPSLGYEISAGRLPLSVIAAAAARNAWNFGWHGAAEAIDAAIKSILPAPKRRKARK